VAFRAVRSDWLLRHFGLYLRSDWLLWHLVLYLRSDLVIVAFRVVPEL